MGYALAGLFFLRFFMRTGDRLFASFAAAFWLLALNQALVPIFAINDESRSLVFVLRLAAFVFIIVAIVTKNMNLGERRK